MARSKAKPKSPEQIALERVAKRARDLEAVGIHASAAALERQADIDVAHAEREREDGARRVDVFLALRDGMATGAYDAARRLEADIATRHGEADKGRSSERVDCSSNGFGSTDAMVQAGRDVDAVMARIGPRDGWLLKELIRPTVDRGHWRATVAYITGEENPVAQGAAVRSACDNLSAAYRLIDGRNRIAA
jgi:hypothetical protein